MQKVDLVIVTWHQTYLSSYAGGYVRLKKFLKRIPNDISYVVLDNQKTIYSQEISKKNIIEYTSPKWLSSLQKNYFIIWFLMETIYSTFALFKLSSQYAKNNSKTVFYFPTGEFLQLYIVSLFLKLRYPKSKCLLDILNYGILDKSYSAYFIRLKKNGIGIIRSIVITTTIFFSQSLMSLTIGHADFIVTVSREFAKKIKKDYKKNSIDFTPSGVDIPNDTFVEGKKKYLGIYIGRMTTEKGIFELLGVWSIVVKNIPDAKLLLAGYADDTIKEALGREIKKLKLSENIKYVGDVTETKKYELLSESELFLHLAQREPLFPVITILEGFSMGLPVVIYDMEVYKSANAEFPFSNDSIFVVENGNVQKAANKIISYNILTKKNKMILSKSAKANAKLFEWDSIAKKEFAIIKSLINKK